MLNQLLKFTLISSLFLWLKPRWRGLLALSSVVILTHVFHGEYLSYVELSGDRSLLVWSYVAKWLVLILGVMTYIAYVIYGAQARSSSENGPSQKGSVLTKSLPKPDDGFDFLRKKTQLQSRAEKIVAAKIEDRRM